MALSLAISPCPNDTFVFDALVHGRVPGAPPVEVTYADVDVTNTAAERGAFDLVKVSYAALPWLLDDFHLLPCGGALGRGGLGGDGGAGDATGGGDDTGSGQNGLAQQSGSHDGCLPEMGDTRQGCREGEKSWGAPVERAGTRAPRKGAAPRLGDVTTTGPGSFPPAGVLVVGGCNDGRAGAIPVT